MCSTLSATRRTWGRRDRIAKSPNKRSANAPHEAPVQPADRNGRPRRQNKEITMLSLNRRNALLTAAVAGAAFGLPKPVSFIEAALAQKGAEVGKGFRPFKVGTNHGFILND